MTKIYKQTTRFIIRETIDHNGDSITRSIYTGGHRFQAAKRLIDKPMRMNFVGVSKVNGEWYSVHDVLGELQTYESIS